jgi:hypothetical protein
MKYAVVKDNGAVETRQDNYPLPEGAIPLSDEDFSKLRSCMYILENGQIVENPNPPTCAGEI